MADTLFAEYWKTKFRKGRELCASYEEWNTTPDVSAGKYHKE